MLKKKVKNIILELKADVENYRADIQRLNRELKEARQEEKHLSALSAEHQVRIHNLSFEGRAMFQALADCQKLRKKYQDRVAELERRLSGHSSYPGPFPTVTGE